MIINTATVTEEVAQHAYHLMAARFGWSGTFFTRADAESTWEADDAGQPEFSDEVWNDIQNTWEWRKGLQEILTERGWEIVQSAVESVMSATPDSR